MEKVKFLSDYRGIRTNEIFYTKGSLVELANDAAFELEEMGVVEIVVEKPAKPAKAVVKEEPKPKPKTKSKVK